MLMWAGVIMYVNHLYGISMEEGLLPYNQGMIIAERIIHYIMTVSVYSLYAYLKEIFPNVEILTPLTFSFAAVTVV